MQQDMHQVLYKYYGYKSFRSMQEDIIQSVLDGDDTLALLPTGGGKSICFQVPALCMDGICIVVTPLIALMRDQVDNLKEINIKALAVNSAMSYREIDNALDDCVLGKIKFLYVSPERLKTELFIERLKRMEVCLLAIDESHCISQWGYDFRPSYLEVAEIRHYIPDVPVIAVTATATPIVVDDIQERLLFKKKNVFQKSFLRDNLSYSVFKEEDKLNRLLRILNSVQGSSVVYVRRRKKAQNIAEFLQRNGVSADFFHAGIAPLEKERRQKEWKNNTIRVIVATNAFGMGIDKPDVRLVIHIDIPDNLEAYFQEAGRAGRDEKKAFAVLLYEKEDLIIANRNFKMSFPEIDFVKNIYSLLGNFLNIQVGSGKNMAFDFDFNRFVTKYKLPAIETYNAIRLLELDAYLIYNDSVESKSKLKIIVDNHTLLSQVNSNKDIKNLFHVITRNYQGIFSEQTIINESYIASKMGVDSVRLQQLLKHSVDWKLIDYRQRNNKSQLVYLEERLQDKNLSISKKSYKERRKRALDRMNAMHAYIANGTSCRSIFLSVYFGEKTEQKCGVCDVCLGRTKNQISNDNYDELETKIILVLSDRQMTLNELMRNLPGINEDKLLKVLAYMRNSGNIHQSKEMICLK